MIEGEQSCFRVSSLNGSLEVSARLKSVDDLEILMRVLEANRALFLREVRSNAAPVMTKQEVAEVDQDDDQKRVSEGKAVQTRVCARGQIRDRDFDPHIVSSAACKAPLDARFLGG